MNLLIEFLSIKALMLRIAKDELAFAYKIYYIDGDKNNSTLTFLQGSKAHLSQIISQIETNIPAFYWTGIEWKYRLIPIEDDLTAPVVSEPPKEVCGTYFHLVHRSGITYYYFIKPPVVCF